MNDDIITIIIAYQSCYGFNRGFERKVGERAFCSLCPFFENRITIDEFECNRQLVVKISEYLKDGRLKAVKDRKDGHIINLCVG